MENSQIALEQKKVDEVYARLDALAHDAEERLRKVRAEGSTGSPTYRSERDAKATMYENRAAQLSAVKYRLLFGRLDTAEGVRHYIGRIGLTDDDYKPMLIDWRAEVARPFYEATARNNMGVALRRHIALKNRTVVNIEDEALDIDSAEVHQAKTNGTLNGEGALIASISERRTGVMTDIVATIQAEQDRIIRTPLNTVTVVQGGPGTGKTAVALHRAAYLLYANRRRLSHSGVLIVGPSQAFLHYIGQVLPSLGETGVISQTIGTLLPGMAASAIDSPKVATLKGDRRMARVIKNAIAHYVRVPRDLPTIKIGRIPVSVTADDIANAQNAARRTRQPHNRARTVFVDRMLNLLVRQYAEKCEEDLNQEDIDYVRQSLRLNDSIKRTLNLAWLPLTAEWLLENLYAKPARLAEAAPWMSNSDRALLARVKGSAWTVSDVPLLDEAMELIGDLPDPSAKAAAAERAAQQRYAKDSLAMMGIDSSLISAEQLTDAINSGDDAEALVTRATQDRAWTYGHIVVDEAQELTDMDWRMLLRRCPSRSFTIVGDVAQTFNPGGTHDWKRTMDRVFGEGRWNLQTLTIDYRNPKEVADRANAFARGEGLRVSTVSSARSVPDSIETHTVADADTLVGAAQGTVCAAAQKFLAADGTGRIAIIADAATIASLRAPILDAIGQEFGSDVEKRLESQAKWDSQLDFVTAEQSKGLEYDAVVLINPGEIEANSPNRLSAAANLYVAMTRPTQKLIIVRTEDDERSLAL